MEQEIPFGAFDSELMHQEISIPDGFEANIEGNKIIIKKTEDEDEKIRKELVAFLKETIEYGGISPNIWTMDNSKKWLAWFEKQGKQKETICDKCKKDQPSHSCQDITALGRCYIEGMNTSNKVETKFKVGHWICHNNGYRGPYLITNINEHGVELDNNIRIKIENCYDYYHLWTIQDAKDGDVLATSDYILIFEKIFSKNYGVSHCHYGFGNTTPQFNFNKDDNWYFGKEANVYPATKEERDLLFSKMHEAGYEWDAEKKELKKISKQHLISNYFNAEYERGKADALKSVAWSEDDERIIKRIDSLLYAINDSDFEDIHVWLKSLKGRTQPKQDWSEEDETNSYHLKTLLENLAKDIEYKFRVISDNDRDKYTTWLKSLKERYTWKPSLAQMNALSIVSKGNAPDDMEAIVSLYNDLKKLREE